MTMLWSSGPEQQALTSYWDNRHHPRRWDEGHQPNTVTTATDHIPGRDNASEKWTPLLYQGITDAGKIRTDAAENNTSLEGRCRREQNLRDGQRGRK